MVIVRTLHDPGFPELTFLVWRTCVQGSDPRAGLTSVREGALTAIVAQLPESRNDANTTMPIFFGRGLGERVHKCSFVLKTFASRRYTPGEPKLWNLTCGVVPRVTLEVQMIGTVPRLPCCVPCVVSLPALQRPHSGTCPSRWRWVLQMQRKVRWELRMCPLSELNVTCSPVSQVEDPIRSSKILLGFTDRSLPRWRGDTRHLDAIASRTKQTCCCGQTDHSHRFVF